MSQIGVVMGKIRQFMLWWDCSRGTCGILIGAVLGGAGAAALTTAVCRASWLALCVSLLIFAGLGIVALRAAKEDRLLSYEIYDLWVLNEEQAKQLSKFGIKMGCHTRDVL